MQYTIPAMATMLLEAALAAHLTVNDHWIQVTLPTQIKFIHFLRSRSTCFLTNFISVYAAQDLPDDRTGELHNLLSFINNNLDLCKWAALAIFATQVFSLSIYPFLVTGTLLISAECLRLNVLPCPTYRHSHCSWP